MNNKNGLQYFSPLSFQKKKLILMIAFLVLGTGLAHNIAIAGDAKNVHPAKKAQPPKHTVIINPIREKKAADFSVRPQVKGLKKISPVSPRIRRSLEPYTGLNQKGIRNTLIPSIRAAHMVGAYLSVYAAPFRRWCEDSSSSTTTGRAWATYNFPDDGGANHIGGRLNVVTASGTRSKNITLSFGERQVSSNTITFNKADICSSRCVEVYISANRPGDAARVESGRVRSCVRE